MLKYKSIIDKYLIKNNNTSLPFHSIIDRERVQLNVPNNFKIIPSILHLNFDNNTNNIKISHSGIYIVHIARQINYTSEFVLYINNVPDLSTLTTSYNKSNIITIHQVLSLNAGDTISLRNYI